jgi:hypothetical protein
MRDVAHVRHAGIQAFRSVKNGLGRVPINPAP